MASEEQDTLKSEAEAEQIENIQGTVETVDIQTFYFTSDGILKPIDGDQDSVKFCKAINLMQSSVKPASGDKKSTAKAKVKPKSRRASGKKTEADVDPEFDIADAENTPLRTSSRKSPAPKNCEYCNKPFSEKGLIKHIKNKHPDKISEYTKTVPLELTLWMCPYCEVFMYTKAKLMKHVKETHAEKDDEFSVILDLDMSAENDDASATANNGDTQETPNKNESSNGTNKTRAGTKRAARTIHVVSSPSSKKSRRSEYPKPCPDCGEMIDKSSRWFDHKKKHIPLEERKNHQCGYCDQLYTKRALEVHIKTMHPETVPEKQRTWECRYCDRVFRRTNTRHYHELSHKEDSKKYVCDVCGYGFINRGQLRKHTLTHSNTSVRCSKCRFLFEDVEKLTAHCERVHPGDEVFGMVNEVKERNTPIQRNSKANQRQIFKGSIVPQSIVYGGEMAVAVYESDDSNEANEFYERTQKLLQKKEDGQEEDETNKEDDDEKTNLELFRCKLCNVFYQNKAMLAEHCLELHSDMMEKLVLAGL